MNKKLSLIVIAIAVILIIVGGYLVFTNQSGEISSESSDIPLKTHDFKLFKIDTPQDSNFTVKNEAGALANTLNIIGSHGFNMRALRSRPMKELMWNYYFYIELDGNINTPDGSDMLRQISTMCDRLKLVGTYTSIINK